MRWLRMITLVLVLSVIGAAIAVVDYLRFVRGPMDAPESAMETLQVERGMSAGGIAEQLGDEGWLDRPFYFRLLARLRGDAGRIQAGEYRLERGQSPERLLARLVDGDVIRYRITIIEGWTFSQMRRVVENHEAIETTLADASGEEIMEQLGRDESPEGWFYPDTYSFERGMTDLRIYRRAHRRMEEVLTEEWKNRSDDVPVGTPYEALILASIVERETGVTTERRRVAGVFAERLDAGMRLQTDPSVIYGLGDDYDGRLTYADLDTDTPYNTYTRHGLTPTPIALPGRPAIHAAVNPDRRGELYFVATDDGDHIFSKTLEEHNQAVIEHQLDGDASRLRGYQQP